MQHRLLKWAYTVQYTTNRIIMTTKAVSPQHLGELRNSLFSCYNVLNKN